MVSSKILNSHLKTIRGIVTKGFIRLDERLDRMENRMENMDHKIDTLDNKIDQVKFELKQDISEAKIELKQDIDDLAGMAAREFKVVHGEISHSNLMKEMR